jgi:hypothetical protein
MSYDELTMAAPGDSRAAATLARMHVMHTLGNLTMLTAALNTAQSNLPWAQKKAELKVQSLLPINQMFDDFPEWNEAAINKRSELLFERALTIWKR